MVKKLHQVWRYAKCKNCLRFQQQHQVHEKITPRIKGLDEGFNDSPKLFGQAYGSALLENYLGFHDPESLRTFKVFNRASVVHYPLPIR